ncbi:hypothetical protein PLICRDRAFT_541980 [Plicaturopsis crispa FD-325 SS-3]|nr:hypothetical protein PLICRDRAFT_541980 [Plicaturopsis crispa FD-325 SS-3]
MWTGFIRGSTYTMLLTVHTVQAPDGSPHRGPTYIRARASRSRSCASHSRSRASGQSHPSDTVEKLGCLQSAKLGGTCPSDIRLTVPPRHALHSQFIRTPQVLLPTAACSCVMSTMQHGDMVCSCSYGKNYTCCYVSKYKHTVCCVARSPAVTLPELDYLTNTKPSPTSPRPWSDARPPSRSRQILAGPHM